MSVLRKARKIKVIFAVAGAIGVIAVNAYVHHLKSVPTLQRLSNPALMDSQSEDQTDDKESSFNEQLPLGSLLGYNKPAPPPIVMHVGRPPAEANTPDLSTPAATVYSVLSLIDQTATDKLAPCFIQKPEDAVGNLYPRYLGQPIELVEVAEEDEYAEVIWNATVHTNFSLDGRDWSQGEMMMLKTTLVRVEGLWKISKLYDRGKDGPK